MINQNESRIRLVKSVEWPSEGLRKSAFKLIRFIFKSTLVVKRKRKLALLEFGKPWVHIFKWE